MANKMKKRNAILKANEGREFDYKTDHVLNIKEYFDYDRNLWFDEPEIIFLAGLAEAGLEEHEIYFKYIGPKKPTEVYNFRNMREDGDERKRFMDKCGRCIYYLDNGGNVTSEGIYLETAGENNGNQYRYYKAMYVVKM